MASRARWTDDRLDDAFAELRADVRELRPELLEMRCWLMGMFATMVLGMLAILVEVAVQS